MKFKAQTPLAKLSSAFHLVFDFDSHFRHPPSACQIYWVSVLLGIAILWVL
jgi:hypothetical protein